MIVTGPAVPEGPPVLPGLHGLALLEALRAEQRRLVFLTEHMSHPLVPEGVGDAVHDALEAMRNACDLQRQLLWDQVPS